MASERTVIQEIREVARILYEKDAVDSHSGNLSVRVGATVWITRTGARLGYLTEEDIVQLDLSTPAARARELAASTEWPVHQAVYRASSRIHAVIHAHPPYLTAWGWQVERFVPMDVEGRYYVPEVPVLAVREPTGSDELAGKLCAVAGRQPVVVVRDHGAFSMDHSLDLALKRLMAAERSAQLAWIHHLLSQARRD